MITDTPTPRLSAERRAEIETVLSGATCRVVPSTGFSDPWEWQYSNDVPELLDAIDRLTAERDAANQRAGKAEELNRRALALMQHVQCEDDDPDFTSWLEETRAALKAAMAKENRE